MSADAGAELHEWDAAYVLGALSATERALFEEHLETCAECRASVAELAMMPGLLAKVAPSDALGLHSLRSVDQRAPAEPAGRLGREAAEWRPAEPAEPAGRLRPPGRMETREPAETLRTLARRVRRRRVVRRWVAAGSAALAAAAIAAAVVLPMQLNAPPAPTASVTLEQTAPGPLSATVALTSKTWGTALAMKCTYAGTPGAYATTGRYALYVTDADGTVSRVASWSAAPGETIRAGGAIETPVAQLRTVEVRDAASGAILLSSPVN
jgi:anti-sigma factor RsiW